VVCPKCRREGRLKRVRLSGYGHVYSFTVIHTPGIGFEKAVPYVFALVKLDEGPMVSAQIVDVKPEDVKIGMRVKAVFRRIQSEDPEGLIHYAYKFKPVR
jgi:uncharacterized OB-fold protein